MKLMFILIVISDVLSCMSCLNRTDYLSVGLSIEDDTDILYYHGFHYVGFTYHFGTPEMSNQSHCAGWFLSLVDNTTAYVTKLLKHKISILDDPIIKGRERPEAFQKTSIINRRKKRFAWFSSLLGLGGLATSIWNRVSITSLQSEMDKVTNYVARNSKDISLLKTTMVKLIDDRNKILHIVNDLISDLAEQQCFAYTQSILSLQYELWLSLIPNEFLRAIESLLLGKLNFDLLPSGHLHKLLESDEFSSSIYRYNPALVYNLATIYTNFSKTDSLLLKGVIVLPRLLPHKTRTLSNIYNVGVRQDNMIRRLIVPEQLTKSYKTGSYYNSNLENCINHVGFFTCPISSLSNQPETCINNINNNITAYCSWESKTYSQCPVEAMRSGVLVGNCKGSIKIIQVDKYRHLEVIDKTLPDSPSILTTKDGDHAIIDDEVYQLIIQEVDVNSSFSSIEAIIPAISLPLFDLQDWIPDSQLLEQSLDIIPSAHSDILLIISLFLSVLLTVGGFLLVRRKINALELQIQHKSSHTETRSFLQ